MGARQCKKKKTFISIWAFLCGVRKISTTMIGLSILTTPQRDMGAAYSTTSIEVRYRFPSSSADFLLAPSHPRSQRNTSFSVKKIRERPDNIFETVCREGERWRTVSFPSFQSLACPAILSTRSFDVSRPSFVCQMLAPKRTSHLRFLYTLNSIYYIILLGGYSLQSSAGTNSDSRPMAVAAQNGRKITHLPSSFNCRPFFSLSFLHAYSAGWWRCAVTRSLEV